MLIPHSSTFSSISSSLTTSFFYVFSFFFQFTQLILPRIFLFLPVYTTHSSLFSFLFQFTHLILPRIFLFIPVYKTHSSPIFLILPLSLMLSQIFLFSLSLLSLINYIIIIKLILTYFPFSSIILH